MLEELDIQDKAFELTHRASSDGAYLRIMDEYPSPKNTFDIHMNAEGHSNYEGQLQTGYGDKPVDPDAPKDPKAPKDRQGVDPNQVIDAAETFVDIVDMLGKSEVEKNLKSRCGRRPVFAKNRDAWNKCRDSFYANLEQQYAPQTPSYQPSYKSGGKKPMGAGAIIGIGLGVLALGIGTYYVVKKMNAGKVVKAVKA